MKRRIRVNGKLYEAVGGSATGFARKLARLNRELEGLVDEANGLGLDDTDLTTAVSYIDSFLRDLNSR